MPELPEVEITRRGIAPALRSRTITAVTVREPRLRWRVIIAAMSLMRRIFGGGKPPEGAQAAPSTQFHESQDSDDPASRSAPRRELVQVVQLNLIRRALTHGLVYQAQLCASSQLTLELRLQVRVLQQLTLDLLS